MTTKKTISLGLILGLALIGLSPASAADLGGNCCADLEERVAELEATTARKGGSKVSLQIYGQVNASLLYIDVEDFNETSVQQDGREETFIGFRGQGKISPDLSAGFVLEIDLRQLGLLDSGVGSVDPGTRQAYVYLKSEAIGAVAVGQAAQATRDFNRISTANTSVVALPNSLQPISDAYLTGLDLPYDGRYRNIVRYDSPSLAGFKASASWGSAVTAADDEGQTYDIALKYAGESGGFRVVGGLGYRHDEDFTIEILDVTTIDIGTGKVETYLASGSVMHISSGLFVSAYYADQDWEDAGIALESWHVQGGVERKLFTTLGDTTVYAEYGETDVDLGGTVNIPVYGIGVVQSFDSAALDLYAGYRQIDLDELGADKVDQFSAGARISF